MGSLLDRLILGCYRFNHLERKYSLNIMLVVRAAGVMTVVGLGAMVGFFLIRDRRRARAGVAAGSGDETTGRPADGPAEGVT